MKGILYKILDFINLYSGEEDRQKVLENVKGNISFRGANFWILACAIVIASVGLNLNSTAVVIGAMLISPLMGPIVGAGFGLGIYDFELLKKALKNLLIATIVGLFVSTIYFYLSPFKDTQSELLSRTSPNIYDIFIAFFGGLVGVIAITRVEKGNPIPGVAIATALMPPLCTAGYGLAIGNFSFFFGAIYLYTINCVFICIATFFIVKYLKYPQAKQVDEKREKRVRFAMTAIIVVLIIPSIYFAYVLIEQRKFNQKVEAFINDEFTSKGYTILYKKIKTNIIPKRIELVFLTKKTSKDELKILNQRLKTYGIESTELKIRQDTTDIKKYISNQINFEKSILNEKDVKIANLEKLIKKNSYDNKAILAETKIIFPEIENLSISNHVYDENSTTAKVVPVMVYISKKELSKSSKKKLVLWLQQRLSKGKVEIYRQG
ncbi:putative hydrophobic protein (TIGR00271 family) [Flavobacterium sp. CG_23.5]|uniref:TIGR00341 family protein n=1 Tax=unclassified Flavobacterium TaxID=196869 RepID=UPI0018C8E2EA|nr:MULTISPECIES: TIGR00341 family protein [unclassified Flavobacterium]MBG6109468.1 putative hydrophobic protein (TIGR00271 family) [Flavobacterium sp. CG_9.10]MBP2283288.1 putative hydrophobic protein (TIGR00271 family) [Flavobacterium sp. CG_23.5]